MNERAGKNREREWGKDRERESEKPPAPFLWKIKSFLARSWEVWVRRL